MAITLDSNRQYELTAWVAFTYEDIAYNVPAAAIELPANSVVVSGAVVVDTDFNDDAAETFTLDVGDSGAQAAADPNRYTGTPLSVDGDAGTAQAIVPTGYVYTEPTSIVVELNPSVGASNLVAGAARLRITYLVQGRGNENQG